MRYTCFKSVGRCGHTCEVPQICAGSSATKVTQQILDRDKRTMQPQAGLQRTLARAMEQSSSMTWPSSRPAPAPQRATTVSSAA